MNRVSGAKLYHSKIDGLLAYFENASQETLDDVVVYLSYYDPESFPSLNAEQLRAFLHQRNNRKDRATSIGDLKKRKERIAYAERRYIQDGKRNVFSRDFDYGDTKPVPLDKGATPRQSAAGPPKVIKE